jgi:LysM repeat protein
MKLRIIFLVGLFVPALLFIGAALTANRVSAAPHAQGFVTNTPGADGRIIYVVVANDTCLQIALLHNITVPQLRQFNDRLDQDCTLSVGQQLVVGLAQPEPPTAGPAPTLEPPTPTSTPFDGTTEVCILLFNDANGDALRQETEFGIDGGAVSLTNLNGSYAQTQTTTSAIDPDLLEPVRSCFSDVPQGDYNVSMAIPDGYNPTMAVSYTLTVKAGDRASMDFGAQSKTVTVGDPAETAQNRRSPVLGIFGLILLLVGAGLGYYAYRSNQPRSKLKDSPLMKR